MANDNTLGAPTEGLGQTVTFTADGGGGVPQTGSTQRQMVRNAPGQGGARLTAQALQVPPAQPDPTFAALMKLGGEIVKPHVEQAKKEAYARGMQRAAQNEAITEIVEEQPWYSKVFGPTSLVDGARAYTASATAATTVAKLVEEMPELRKLSATEFSRYTADKLLQANTGDATTDTLVMQQLTQKLPDILGAQAKNHLAYKNELLAENMGADQMGKAAYLAALNKAVRNGAYKDDDSTQSGDVAAAGMVLKAELDLSASFSTPPPGMDKAAHQKIVLGTVAKSLAAGNFAPYSVLERSGQLDAMEIPVASAMRTAYRQAQAEARMNLPVEFSQELRDLVFASQRGVKEEEIISRTEALNKKYTRFTGDPAKFRDSGDLAKDLLRNEVSFYQDQERLRNLQRTATTKAAKEQATIDESTDAAVRIANGLPTHGLTEDQSRASWAMAEAKNPAAAPWMRVAGLDNENVDKQFKILAQGTFGAALAAVSQEDAAKGVINPKAKPLMLHQGYMKFYLPLVKASGDKGEAAAQFYAGDYKEVMARYHKFFAGRDPASMNEEHMAAAYNVAVMGGAKPPPVSKEERNKGTAFLKQNPWMHSYMPAKNADGLFDLLAPHLNRELGVEVAVPVAARALKHKLNVVGGYHWWVPSGATGLQTYAANELQKTDGDKALKIVGSELDAAFDYSVSKLAAEAGFAKIKGVHQSEDNKGVPYFLIENDTMVEGGSRKVEFILLSGDKVLSDWNSRRGTVTPEKVQEAEKLKSMKPRVVRDPVTGVSKFEPFGQPR